MHKMSLDLRIDHGSQKIPDLEPLIKGMEGDARLINDADGDDENQICHLYLMRGVMNSLFAKRNAENAN